MSRHNRRRTRGHTPKSALSFSSSSELSFPNSSSSCTPYTYISSNALNSNNNGNSITSALQRGHQARQRTDLTVRHWHNRYLAWQSRERGQREERAKLEAERRRIFGGEEGDEEDDEGLCGAMMEYFGGLDFIEG
ncbi:hypothetical protein MMC06_003072 [Schaereria dolodes]|nr:hypothetical protein [Schaereria dolodes]